MNQEGIFKDDEFLYAQKKSNISASALPNCVGSRSINWQNCFGTYTFSNGAKYVGEFGNDEKHGQGTYTFEDGSKWVGAWENNNLNGYAITYYADGSINQEGIFNLRFNVRTIFI